MELTATASPAGLLTSRASPLPAPVEDVSRSHTELLFVATAQTSIPQSLLGERPGARDRTGQDKTDRDGPPQAPAGSGTIPRPDRDPPTIHPQRSLHLAR
jgi:hypothetical protein